MNQPPSPGLTLLSASTIADSLYPHLSVADVLNVNRVCHATHLAVKAWLPSTYNINKHLEPFFGNLATTLQFRSIQAATETIISGSQALQFFDRARYVNSDLDIYTPCRHIFLVGTFLLSIGYRFQPSARQLETPMGSNCLLHLEEVTSRRESGRDLTLMIEEHYDWAFLEEVFTFTREEVTNGEQVTIQLIAVDPKYPSLACVLHFHSTLVMNFITHDTAYALFPRETFLDRLGVTLGRNGNLDAIKRAYAKYIGRNFRISVIPLHPQSQSSPLSPGHRWVGDRQTWTIKLDTMDVIVPDWLIRAYNIFGRPLITGHGFTVQNGPAKGATDENPSKHRYTDGNSLLCFEALISPILRSALLLPVHDYPEARAGPSGYHMWTSYPNAFDFLRFQEKFEIAKYENPDLTLQTVAPDLIPGWQYWDVELLALAQKDYEKWKRRFI